MNSYDYELDFIGSHDVVGDADAVGIRYKTYDGRFVCNVYDAGTAKLGESLIDHLNRYYGSFYNPVTIKYLFCSHSHDDHLCGVPLLLEKVRVENIVMNRPWKFIDNLYECVKDGRITRDSLKARLLERYKNIAKIEEIANERNIRILDGFQGSGYDNFVILSPSQDEYINYLKESEKTPAMESVSCLDKTFSCQSSGICYETWNRETLNENVITDPENETSIVLLGVMGEGRNFILTGDAGVRAMTSALNFAKRKNIDLSKCAKIQIPHHGGRHNVSPDLLNKLIGSIRERESKPDRVAIASVGFHSDHPRRVVVNAFIRRGCVVLKTNGSTIRTSCGAMPERQGWQTCVPLEFNNIVEE